MIVVIGLLLEYSSDESDRGRRFLTKDASDYHADVEVGSMGDLHDDNGLNERVDPHSSQLHRTDHARKLEMHPGVPVDDYDMSYQDEEEDEGADERSVQSPSSLILS
ncbi:uncharacterized protein MYCGRDRAFT_98014 [Zymoseptoria tritici IPO323]|uniref:Uncharacterized protein n=1 Tax=Zymoseptoria tritici (strain CBS 115943 / IPO323) TaxID=336722 RepID=F9XS25_ZYMTI|nr:uncharacterized protein MYCGRDRAFT_98014 [Zymoseptoria tritici IPO323]EGP81953.1 hypothetical protein MYCGRDRAFT_98014 [Zymoseptoria tritici IPO323]